MATIALFVLLPAAQAGYKTISTCLTDPLFATCVSRVSVPSAGGAQMSGAAPWLYNDTTTIHYNETTGNRTYYTQLFANQTFLTSHLVSWLYDGTTFTLNTTAPANSKLNITESTGKITTEGGLNITSGNLTMQNSGVTAKMYVDSSGWHLEVA